MKLHRNPFKRLHIPGAIYFLTTVTRDRFPYFVYDHVCRIMVAELQLYSEAHWSTIYSYKVNPDHVHILVAPGTGTTISKFMFCVKKNISHNVNRMLGYLPREPLGPREPGEALLEAAGIPKARPCQHRIDEHRNIINDIFESFDRIHGPLHGMPKFRWQLSYHDHRIRDRRDFFNHVRYIRKQWKHHRLHEYRWCYIAPGWRDW